MTNVFSIHGKNIVDLIQEMPPDSQQPPVPAAPVSYRVRGNNNIVIGGSVSIHLLPSACPIQKESCNE